MYKEIAKEYYYSLDVTPTLGDTLDIGDYSYIIASATPLSGTDSMYKVVETDLTISRKESHKLDRLSSGG